MLVSIGKNLGKLNEHNCAQLPAARSTLYFLSLLPESALLAGLEDETKNPELSANDAKALLKGGMVPEEKSTSGFNVTKVLRRIHKLVDKLQSGGRQDDKDRAIEALSRYAGQLATNPSSIPAFQLMPSRSSSYVAGEAIGETPVINLNHAA